MKKAVIYLSFFSLVALLTFTGCKKTVQDAVNNTISNYLYTQLEGGYWTITRYSEGTKDSTSLYANWRTFFNSNNQMLSYKTDTSGKYIDSAFGAWSSSDLSHFTCNYTTGSQYPLDKLSDTWTVDPNNTNLSNKVSLARVKNGLADTLQMLKH